jgi:DNA-3-methyladenine glycosylase
MRLDQDFFRRDALDVAHDVVGALLVRGPVTLRITEVEAYRANGDTANHCRFGLTARNAAMFGPPGHAYIYLCYGLHWMLNLVTDEADVGAAVLVRSAEVIQGHDVVLARRFAGRATPKPSALSRRRLDELLAGPGKVGQALDLGTALNHHPLYRRGGLEIHVGQASRPELAVGPRVGIDYADPEHRDAPWRVADANSPSVSVRKTLSPPTRVKPSVRGAG